MNTNLLHPYPVSSRNFIWVPDGKLFVQEASTLQATGFRTEQVYKDAADEGFTFVSRYTYRAEIVMVAEHHEVRGGDLLYTDYRPADLTDRQVHDFTVRIYND